MAGSRRQAAGCQPLPRGTIRQSGGRPKGARNRPRAPRPFDERLKAIILTEAYRKVPVTDAKGTTKIPMIQAAVRSMAVNAAKGSPRAQRQFTDLVSAIEREKQRLHTELVTAVTRYKLDWHHEQERRARLGTSGPEPLLHPDDVTIDASGRLEILALTPPEKAAAEERCRRLRAMLEEELAEQIELRDEAEGEERARWTTEIASTEQAIAFVGQALQGSRTALRTIAQINMPEEEGGDEEQEGE